MQVFFSEGERKSRLVIFWKKGVLFFLDLRYNRLKTGVFPLLCCEDPLQYRTGKEGMQDGILQKYWEGSGRSCQLSG